MPILGVCLGHQCIGHSFGGEVIRNDRVMHGKTSLIHPRRPGRLSRPEQPVRGDALSQPGHQTRNLPQPRFRRYAWTDEGEIMGVRHRTWPLHGVQFHPESFLTLEGPRLLKNFVEISYPPLLPGEGRKGKSTPLPSGRGENILPSSPSGRGDGGEGVPSRTLRASPSPSPGGEGGYSTPPLPPGEGMGVREYLQKIGRFTLTPGPSPGGRGEKFSPSPPAPLPEGEGRDSHPHPRPLSPEGEGRDSHPHPRPLSRRGEGRDSPPSPPAPLPEGEGRNSHSHPRPLSRRERGE